VRVHGNFRGYKNKDNDGKSDGTPQAVIETAKVWEVQHKRNGQVFTVVDGFPDFIKMPSAPDVQIERFWTVFTLVFNEVEDTDNPYPPSDIELMEHPQKEYNRSRQALREHRIANAPMWFVSKGRLDDKDKMNLEAAEPFSIIELNALESGQRLEELIQRSSNIGIDPNVYEVNPYFTDILRSVGTQEANLGGTSNSTATESTIAEQSRLAGQSDNVDDLDEFLSELARSTGQLLLTELNVQTVQEIVGAGAVWPEQPVTREEAAKEMVLAIRAGSSGRPNQAVDLANLERAAPLLVQLPGINPKPIAEKLSTLLDVDVEELITDGLPSITAVNAMFGQSQPGTGDPATDPNSQGAAGAQNAPAVNGTGGSPAEFPAGDLAFS